MKKLVWGAAVAALMVGAGAFALAQTHGSGHGAGHGSGQTHAHGADGTGHDTQTMPGLRGANATEEESAEMALLFRRFDTLSREVENLPNGIRTVTRSSDPEVMDALVSHSVGMIDRVEQLDDPEVIIQSSTLDILFVRGKSIVSDVQVTEDGLVVVQTSDDPEVVAALQTHAAEVTGMVDEGMGAVHRRMMEQGVSH